MSSRFEFAKEMSQEDKTKLMQELEALQIDDDEDESPMEKPQQPTKLAQPPVVQIASPIPLSPTVFT